MDYYEYMMDPGALETNRANSLAEANGEKLGRIIELLEELAERIREEV